VDSLDYKDLSLILPKDASVYLKMEAAAIKAFVNSDGEMAEFAFDGSTNTVYSGDKIVFDGSDELEESPVPEEEEINVSEGNDSNGKASSIGIIGGADGPTAIFLSGKLSKALIVPVIIYTIVILGIGFAIGYFIKNK